MSGIPLNIDWQQILLHLLNFIILGGGLYLLLYSPVKKFMDGRAEYYKKLDKQAKEQFEQLKEQKEQYNAFILQEENKISELRENAEKQAEKTAQDLIKQAEEQAEKIISEAKEQAHAKRTEILDGTQKEIADMVTAATEKMLSQSSVSDAFDQFLTQAEGSGKDE